MYQYQVTVAPLDPAESTLALNKAARKGWRVAAVLYTNHLVLEREAREEVEQENLPAKVETLPTPVEVIPPTDFVFEPDEPEATTESEVTTEEVASEIPF